MGQNRHTVDPGPDRSYPSSAPYTVWLAKGPLSLIQVARCVSYSCFFCEEDDFFYACELKQKARQSTQREIEQNVKSPTPLKTQAFFC